RPSRLLAKQGFSSRLSRQSRTFCDWAMPTQLATLIATDQGQLRRFHAGLNSTGISALAKGLKHDFVNRLRVDGRMRFLQDSLFVPDVTFVRSLAESAPMFWSL
ncbi:MAG: hypothetical protein WBN34_03125, partial [Woeseia sp.]